MSQRYCLSQLNNNCTKKLHQNLDCITHTINNQVSRINENLTILPDGAIGTGRSAWVAISSSSTSITVVIVISWRIRIIGSRITRATMIMLNSRWLILHRLSLFWIQNSNKMSLLLCYTNYLDLHCTQHLPTSKQNLIH